jgi:phenylalanyl-tRNA synthetase beta chain
VKIPLKWLRDYVECHLPAAELAERLTLAGLEVSGFRCYGLQPPTGLRIRQDEPGPIWDRDKVVLAQVVAVEKHPNADKLKLVHLNYGGAEPKVVVTGAPNLQVGDSGQKVVLGLCGTRYFDGHVSPRQIKELKPSVLRGVPSDAMVMSEYELGITEEHEGIILLEPEAPIGVPAVDFLGDLVLEVDVLPNMARCLSLIGVAREVSALTGKPLCLPDKPAKATGAAITGRVQIVLADPALSPRYAAGLIEGVTVAPSPGWMQRRLKMAGMRPINNLVDITNYVMLEWGQPLHAFDYEVLLNRAGGKAPTITVRLARPGEVLKTLDGVERQLTPEMLVIADEVGPIALAGVMGGAETEVSEKTTRVLLESASFDFVSIRRTSRALDLPSEASLRFSRGVAPHLVPIALGRASDLMRQIAGGVVAKGIVDVYPAPKAPQVVELKVAEIRRLLGVEIPLPDCERILTALDFKVERVGSMALRVTVPPDRLDIQEGPADLIEDIARLYGYDRLPATLLRDELPETISNPAIELEERVRDTLVTLGLQEVITYALTTPEREAALQPPPAEYVRLLNPISSERVVMRQSVLASVLEVLANNLRQQANDVRFFEIGRAYLGQPGQRLPIESTRLAVALCGQRYHEFWGDAGQIPVASLDFYDLKGVVEGLLSELHVTATFRPAVVPMLHPGKGAEIVAGERVLGVLGELHPRVASRLELAGKRVLVAEIDLAGLQAALPPRYAYRPVSRFPVALRDVALIVEESIPAERIEAEIRNAGGELLREIRLFDLYKGDNIPEGSRSLAYALTYQADDRTLTDKEVEKAHRAVENRLRQTLKAQIRGQDDSRR